MAASMLAMTQIAQIAQVAQVSSFSRVSVQGARPSSLAVSRRLRMGVSRAAPTGSSGPAINTGDKVTEKMEDAQEICAEEGSKSEECVTAWGEVEAEKVKQKGNNDPLEEFCEDNPEADECRTYTD